MFRGIRAAIAIAILTVPALLFGLHTAQSQGTPKVHRMVIQVSRDDEGVNLSLGNAMNAKRYYDSKGEELQIEIVAYGPGINMFRADKSEVKDRIEEAKKVIPNLVLSMCNNSKMAAERREGKEIVPLPGVGLVPAGIVRVSELQEQGWSYVRP